MGCSSSRVPPKPGKLRLWYMGPSAPCRSVMLTAKALDIKLELQPLDLMNGEHLKPEFVKINPQHCIPTLDDGGFVLWESRAICAYLVNMYARDDKLYPTDPKKRAVIDQRLDFDQGTLFPKFYDNNMAVLRGKPQTDETRKALAEALQLMENTFLAKGSWMDGGEHYTIADIVLAATVSTIQGVGDELSGYTRLTAWLGRCKAQLPGYKEINEDNIAILKEMIPAIIAKQLQQLNPST